MAHNRRVQSVFRAAVLAGATAALAGAACPNFTGQQRRGENLQCGGERGTPGETGDVPTSADGGRYASCAPVGEFGLRCEEQFVLQGSADVIWVIDNSGSMSEEIKGVQDNVTRFVDKITAGGVDLQTVFVSKKSSDSLYYGINVTESANIHHVDTTVDSMDGPDVLIEEMGSVSLWLREDSTKHVIFVTDDNSTMGGNAFVATTNGIPELSGRVVHAVAGFSTADCPDIAAVGENYAKMVTATGGLKLPICCEDYAALLDILAGDVTASALGLKLTHNAAGTTIHVFLVDDMNVETELTGWTWDAERRSVVFESDGRPEPGSVLRVRYAALD